MARKEIVVEELVEAICQWHMGRGITQIKRSLGLDRKTIRKYIGLAEENGFSRDMPLQTYEYYLQLASSIQGTLRTPIESSSSYRKTVLYQNTIEKLLAKPYMKPKQVYRLLKREYGYPLSYSSFNRYMNIRYPKQPRSCLRIEVRAADKAQVDFGSAGMMTYPECGKHYGFIIDPAKIARGEHKGKVERKIPVVRQQFLSSYEFRDIREANEKVRKWCLQDYGMQVHGTTKKKPFEVFIREEQPNLKPLPEETFDIPLWKEAKVHPDHHIVFDKSYYSAPTRYVGKPEWEKAD